MINIAFKEKNTTSNKVVAAEIILGDFKETLNVLLDYWTRQDYQAQWKEGLARLVGTNKEFEKSVWVTNMQDPETPEGVMDCWVFYREGELVYVRNIWLPFDQFSSPFKFQEIYSVVNKESREREEGETPSEWQISMEDVEEFLGRLRKA